MTAWKRSAQIDLMRAPGDSGVSEDDARRQMKTATELLRRFRSRPGQVLADEVGMGKTYTAMAVAASVALENPSAAPVVVMVPPALREKWPLDWQEFCELYVSGEAPRAESANRAVEFFKLIDDPPGRRPQIIFLKNGAFGLQLRDPWVKLAVVRQALYRRTSMKRERRAVAKWGGRVVGDSSLDRHHPELVGRLLDTPFNAWQRAARSEGLVVTDNPVPDALVETIADLDLEAVREALRFLPSNRSVHADTYVRRAAQRVNEAISELWSSWLESADFAAPLLILDEAHHVKNPGAQLSRLFINEESGGGASPGALAGRFERMLFLTATPFQLGHNELLQVLSRFGGINWSKIDGDPDSFDSEVQLLGEHLSDAQRAMAELDVAWSRLRPDDVARLPEGWWDPDQSILDESADRPLAARRAIAKAIEARDRAQRLLRRWVIRHRKADRFGDGAPRRSYRYGAAILEPGRDGVGLDVDSGSLLPFLLAARAQVAFRAAQTEGGIPSRARALFADGICSSYEAYVDTRRGLVVDEELNLDGHARSREVDWYVAAIARAIPRDDPGARSAHPKIQATVARVRDLWLAGEKVVVFCHFRATGSALRSHISREIERHLVAAAAANFEIPERRVEETLRRLGRRLEEGREGSVVGRTARAELEQVVAAAQHCDEEQRAALVSIMLRFLRSPVVLARYGAPLHREGAAGVAPLFDEVESGGTTLRRRFRDFVEYVDRLVGDRRVALLQALEDINTSGYHADASELAAEGLGERERLIPTVRLANGEVDHAARQRLMLAFNSPLLPEVLIASQVLAEGVDLHHDCRHVIHHDLDWNPSTLEQRTGRVDRLRSKGERHNESIEVSLPYIAQTQDEKMFRVVRDRERWFQVVMGAQHELDESEIDDISERVELPPEAAASLAFRLECH